MENPAENLNKAHLCVHGKLAAGLMTPHVCALCWARPGRMGCILHGHTGVASLDHSGEPRNGDATPEEQARIEEFVAVRNREESKGNDRFRAACEAIHEALHAELMPEDYAQVEAAARDWQAMTEEQRDALLAESLTAARPATEEDFLNHFADEIAAYEAERLTAARPAAMPEEVAARIGKRMRREQKRQLRRICVLAFLRGLGKGAMLVFRVLWMAAVTAAAIACGIALVVLFLTGVLWLIY